jgi:hypothetical protein
MHPALHYDLMKTTRHDLQRSAARQHAAAHARTSGLPRPERRAAAPKRLVRRLAWRLLPS